ncbi:MAG: sulfotransferase [Chloroflexota bacterium]
MHQATHLFIVGRPRTGSTLLQHVLNRSSQVCLAPETHFFRRAKHLRLAERLKGTGDPTALRALAVEMYTPDSFSGKGLWNWLRKNVPVEAFTERLAATDRTLRSLFVLGMTLYAEDRCSEQAPLVLGEKTPEHLADVPQLHAWFPDARFIHTFRDPRAIFTSELRRRQDGRWGLKRRLPWLPDAVGDPALMPIELGHTAITWRAAARLDSRYRRELGDRYLLVRFEDLIGDPEASLRRVCEFLGIAFSTSLLEARRTGSSYTAGRHAGDGFDSKAAERWRDHIHPLASRFLSGALGADMERHGYVP